MLDLAWPHAPPYPANTTVLGGMLRLTTEGTGSDANVSAAFLYTDLIDDDGDMVEVEAYFANGASRISLSELTRLAKARIDERCVRMGQAMVEERQS